MCKGVNWVTKQKRIGGGNKQVCRCKQSQSSCDVSASEGLLCKKWTDFSAEKGANTLNTWRKCQCLAALGGQFSCKVVCGSSRHLQFKTYLKKWSLQGSSTLFTSQAIHPCECFRELIGAEQSPPPPPPPQSPLTRLHTSSLFKRLHWQMEMKVPKSWSQCLPVSEQTNTQQGVFVQSARLFGPTVSDTWSGPALIGASIAHSEKRWVPVKRVKKESLLVKKTLKQSLSFPEINNSLGRWSSACTNEKTNAPHCLQFKWQVSSFSTPKNCHPFRSTTSSLHLMSLLLRRFCPGSRLVNCSNCWKIPAKKYFSIALGNGNRSLIIICLRTLTLLFHLPHTLFNLKPPGCANFFVSVFQIENLKIYPKVCFSC